MIGHNQLPANPNDAPVFDIEKMIDYLLGEKKEELSLALEESEFLSEIVENKNLDAFLKYVCVASDLEGSPNVDNGRRKNLKGMFSIFCNSYESVSDTKIAQAMPTRQDLKDVFLSFTASESRQMFDLMSEEDRMRFVVNYVPVAPLRVPGKSY